MPRSSRSSRPAARPARPSGPSHQQTRSAHTHAPPPQQHAPVQQQQQQQQRQPSEAAQHRQPGLFGQMASTAAGVAVGSAVGHTMANGISSMFGGGHQPEEVQQQEAYQASSENVKNSCEADAKAFTQCLDATNNDMSACKWYLDALKQCQQMASQY
ncbi:uncharacterized protein RHIMIDRAFT_198087 [Rhizopus microsporus ATCC 52813]|uniref:CHCH domain-containing protein n=1 Tax=Rhizopus microsporus ATCC 52813 TaxID=1340429 RepID=A0A2G4T627_RHIZD|nr:uncharacterized protein RHIMIDRAFT_198087 [Rhizopus microsporus ATCC 52813]PHZ16470.1 hypothetical protein RHIMIDRAFT_198087 [Rhizopus microsporus ATCC 52813]